jgi:hypothetical protein
MSTQVPLALQEMSDEQFSARTLCRFLIENSVLTELPASLVSVRMRAEISLATGTSGRRV